MTDREVVGKSSSDGFVKEALIWQHRALMLPSPSPGSPKSMSAGSKKPEPEKKKGVEQRERGRTDMVE